MKRTLKQEKKENKKTLKLISEMKNQQLIEKDSLEDDDYVISIMQELK